MPRVSFIGSLATTSLIVTRKHVIRVCTMGRLQTVSNAINGKPLVSQIRWGIGPKMSDRSLEKKSYPFDEGVRVFAYLKDCSGNCPSQKIRGMHVLRIQ